MKCLASSCRLGWHHPKWEILLICHTEPDVSALLKLLLQREQLAAHNLNLWCTPLGELELGRLADTEWAGSGVGATLPSLSA